MTKEAKFYIAAVVTPGVAALVWAGLHWSCPDLRAFAVYLAIALLLGVARIRLPRLQGTYSLSFVAVLYGVNHFSSSEVLAAAAMSAVAGSFVNARKRPKLSQVLFNSSNLVLSAGSCLLVFGALADRIPYLPATLSVMVALYFAINTLLVSGILSLVQGKPLASVCEAWYLWSFIYYLAGAMALGLAMSPAEGVASWVTLLPIAYLIWFFWSIRSKAAPSPSTGGLMVTPSSAQMYIRAVAAAGGLLLVAGLAMWTSASLPHFATCVAVAAVASCCKVRLPGMVGTISTNFVVILFAASEMGWGETMAIAAVAAVAQTFWKARTRPQAVRVIFNVATVVLSSTAAYAACRAVAASFFGASPLAASLLVATVVYYALNTVLVCVVLGLMEQKNLGGIWEACRFWSLPYFTVGTVATGIMVAASRTSNFYTAFLVLGVMWLVFLAYRVHLKNAGISSPSPAV